MDTILMFAFRYALGRRSTAPSFVADYIKDNSKALTDYTRTQIVWEIDQAIETNAAGDKCDVNTWIDLKEFLMKELGK